MRIQALIIGVCAALFLAAPAAAQTMPPTDRAWTVTDLPAAFAALRTVPVGQLPGQNSAVLARLSEATVLDYCRDGSVGVVPRLQACLTAFQSEVEILGLYMGLCDADPTRGDDCMRVAESLLYGAGVINRLMDEFVPTLDPNDPSYAQRVAAAQTKQGLATMISGAITMLNERHLYSVAARARFAAVLAQTYPQVASGITPERRATLEQSMRDLARNDPSEEVRTALAAFNT